MLARSRIGISASLIKAGRIAAIFRRGRWLVGVLNSVEEVLDPLAFFVEGLAEAVTKIAVGPVRNGGVGRVPASEKALTRAGPSLADMERAVVLLRRDNKLDQAPSLAGITGKPLHVSLRMFSREEQHDQNDNRSRVN